MNWASNIPTYFRDFLHRIKRNARIVAVNRLQSGCLLKCAGHQSAVITFTALPVAPN